MTGQKIALGAVLFFGIATTSLAHAQVSDDVVKLGVLSDISGPYSDSTGTGSVIAAEMAIADFGGKVLGKPVELISGDHQHKADIGSALARRWYDQEQVDAIVDAPGSAVALAVQEITRDKDRLFLMSGAASSDLTGKACSPNGIQWTLDSYSLTKVAGKALMERGLDSWFFIVADYAYGHALQRDATAVVTAGGGKVLGGLRHPLNSSDYSSYLLQAQSSGAKVVAFGNSGSDTEAAIKQAHEFGLPQGGQTMLSMSLMLTDTKAMGLETARGIILADAFYWDLDEETRAFSKRFHEKVKRMPTSVQAGVYSIVTHYLKAVQAAGTDTAKTVAAKMRELPIRDFFARNATLREDGRMVHDMYLLQVKTPQESKGPWDIYKVLTTVPGEQAFRPMSEGGCPLGNKS